MGLRVGVDVGWLGVKALASLRFRLRGVSGVELECLGGC